MNKRRSFKSSIFKSIFLIGETNFAGKTSKATTFGGEEEKGIRRKRETEGKK